MAGARTGPVAGVHARVGRGRHPECGAHAHDILDVSLVAVRILDRIDEHNRLIEYSFRVGVGAGRQLIEQRERRLHP